MSAVSQVKKNLFETCCRLCLATSNDRTLIDVFTVNNLSTIIRDMFNINITRIDKCTTRICTTCLADSYDFNRKNNKYLQDKSRVLKNFELLSRKPGENLDTPSISKTAGCVGSGTTVEDISPIADHTFSLQESAATSKRLVHKKRKSTNGSDESESRTKVTKGRTNIVARSGSNTLLSAADDANASSISNRGSTHKHNKEPKSAGKVKLLGNTATPDPRNIEHNSVTMKNATSKTDSSKTMRIAHKNPNDTANKEMNVGKSPCSSVSGGLADKNGQEKESSAPNKHRASSKVLQTKGQQDQSQNKLQTSTYRIPRVKRVADVSMEQIAGSNLGAANGKEQQSMTNLKTVRLAIAQSTSSAQPENLDGNMNTLVDANTATQKPSSSDKASPVSVEKPSADDRQSSVDQGKTTSESIDIQSLDITEAQNEADQLGQPSSFSSVDKSSEATVIETSSPATKSPKVGIKHRRHSTYGSIRVCTNLFDAPQKSVEFAAIRNDLMIRKPPPDEPVALSNGAANNRPDPSTIGQNHDDTVVSVSPMQISVPNMSNVRPPPPRRKSVCFGVNNRPILPMLKNVSLSSDPTRLFVVQQLGNNATANSVRPLQQVSVTRALPSGMNTSMPPGMVLSATSAAPRNVIVSPMAPHPQASSTAGPPIRTYGRQSLIFRAVPSVTAGIATPSQPTVNTQIILVRPPHHQVSAVGACALRTFRRIDTSTPSSTAVTLSPPVMASQFAPGADSDTF